MGNPDECELAEEYKSTAAWPTVVSVSLVSVTVRTETVAQKMCASV